MRFALASVASNPPAAYRGVDRIGRTRRSHFTVHSLLQARHFRVLTSTTTSATDHITRSAMLHSEGRANSSAPTPQRRPMNSKAGMAGEGVAACLRSGNAAGQGRGGHAKWREP